MNEQAESDFRMKIQDLGGRRESIVERYKWTLVHSV